MLCFNFKYIEGYNEFALYNKSLSKLKIPKPLERGADTEHIEVYFLTDYNLNLIDETNAIILVEKIN